MNLTCRGFITRFKTKSHNLRTISRRHLPRFPVFHVRLLSCWCNDNIILYASCARCLNHFLPCLSCRKEEKLTLCCKTGLFWIYFLLFSSISPWKFIPLPTITMDVVCHELVQFMQLSTRPDMKLTATKNVLSLTGSPDGKKFIVENKCLLEVCTANLFHWLFDQEVTMDTPVLTQFN